MGPFVLLAVALAVLTVGLVVVAVVVLVRAVKALAGAMGEVSTQLAGLVDELNAEAAVASLEVDHLQRRLAQRSRGVTAGDARGGSLDFSGRPER
jgi:uncharacterized protein YoxC